MKTSIQLFSATLVLLLATTGCDRLESTVSGKLISQSTCKSSKGESYNAGTPDDQSCAVYSYDGATKKLSVTHINAGFNCCPGKLKCIVALTGNTLEITERETSAMCSCNCLFDLKIEAEGINPQIYTIKFNEPYCGGQEKLEFTVDLESNPLGSFCVTRKQYPWGMTGE